jgi:hypothetical protein
MSHDSKTLQQIRDAAKIKLLFLPHALRQMNRPERMIGTGEVRMVVETGEVIEDYPDDARGHSCLMLGYGESDRPIHVVCARKPDYLAIITAYIPDEREWAEDFTQRKVT